MGVKTNALSVTVSSDPWPVQDAQAYGVPDGVCVTYHTFPYQDGTASGSIQKAQGWCDEDPEANTDYADLPKGTVLFDATNSKIYMKTGAPGTNTWVNVSLT